MKLKRDNIGKKSKEKNKQIKVYSNGLIEKVLFWDIHVIYVVFFFFGINKYKMDFWEEEENIWMDKVIVVSWINNH